MKKIPPFVVYWAAPGTSTQVGDCLATGFTTKATAEAFLCSVWLFRPGYGRLWTKKAITAIEADVARDIWNRRGVMHEGER